MKVVSDTSSIIAFSNLGKLHILKALFKRITIPRAVYDELCEGEPFQLEEWIDVDTICSGLTSIMARVRRLSYISRRAWSCSSLMMEKHGKLLKASG